MSDQHTILDNTTLFCLDISNIVISNQPEVKDITSSINNKTTIRNCNFRRNLQRTVLAINFNSPFYEIIPLLKRFYNNEAKLFGKVVFCGSKKFDGVLQVEENGGYQGYVCLSAAIKANPGYDGYLYSNDDLLLNWWNLNGDLSRVWTGSSYRNTRTHKIGQRHSKGDWHWWTDETQTAVRCEKAFKRVLESVHNSSIKDSNIKQPKNFGQYLARFYKNAGNQTTCIVGRSDFFHVPKMHVEAYVYLSRIYSEEKVFLEVAVPTILTFLANYDENVNLNGVYYVDTYGYTRSYQNGVDFFKTYDFDIVFSHPFKLAKKTHFKRFFLDVVIPYGEKMYNDCEN